MKRKIKKWLTIVFFAFSVFTVGNLWISSFIASMQEQYAKAVWYFIGAFGWVIFSTIAYLWYDKNK